MRCNSKKLILVALYQILQKSQVACLYGKTNAPTTANVVGARGDEDARRGVSSRGGGGRRGTWQGWMSRHIGRPPHVANLPPGAVSSR